MDTIGSVVYVALLAVLSIYGLHRYALLFLYLRHYRRRARTQPPVLSRLPSVTIQLPLYNERYVAGRIIPAAARVRYPRELLRVQVLDDSTDDTGVIARRVVEEVRANGVRVEYHHRDHRDGFKAGALAAGLEATPDELVAIFDADFVPPADFLEKTVPHFADASVGMVQTRWTYLNRDYSLLTRLQALVLDGHFMLEHAARSASGRYFNFNGTAGIFRAAAIRDAGGWHGDTLTEDLDLSYRTQMRGWKFVYLPEVECPSELPVDIHGLKNQQYRWTKGSIQVARKLLPRIWRARAPLSVKVEATFHLSANLSHLVLVALSLVMPFAVARRARAVTDGGFVIEALAFGVTTASVLIFYAVAQRELSRGWKLRLRDLPAILALGIGMCVNNAWAVAEALAGIETPFVRTAKYRIESWRDRWKGKLYRSVQRRFLLAEFLLCLYTGIAFAMVAWLNAWTALPYLGLFLAGHAYVFGLSLIHGRR
ncbi:MAG TPA: glycosyltransferase [Candidatus Krumholzibacteria bacterium]|nr:glycosyltransferase [Candidatus Krumholzibacteria bacterium]